MAEYKHKKEKESYSKCSVERVDSPKGSKLPVEKYNHNYTSSDDSDDESGNKPKDLSKYSEWTVSKRKINHTTRQIETRVSRQLVMDGGKVIADSGPQVVTRIKEDNKVEESEKKRTPKSGSKGSLITSSSSQIGKLKSGQNASDSDGDEDDNVLGEKREIQRKSHEVREENMQYHDEQLKELSGHDVHRKAVKSPNDLLTLKQASNVTSDSDSDSSTHRRVSRGKMVHYSNKAKKYQDTDEIVEISKLALDGSVTKEVKHTRHHEEFSDDEQPDEANEAEALREAPTVSRSHRRHFDYVNDFDDMHTPDCSDSEQIADSTQKSGKKSASPFSPYSQTERPSSRQSAGASSSRNDKRN